MYTMLFSLDHWTIRGPSVDHPWTIHGPSMDHPWSIGVRNCMWVPDSYSISLVCYLCYTSRNLPQSKRLGTTQHTTAQACNSPPMYDFILVQFQQKASENRQHCNLKTTRIYFLQYGKIPCVAGVLQSMAKYTHVAS